VTSGSGDVGDYRAAFPIILTGNQIAQRAAAGCPRQLAAYSGAAASGISMTNWAPGSPRYHRIRVGNCLQNPASR